MKTVIEMADEVFDRMLPDGHCREPYWTATEDELKRFAELVRADEREKYKWDIHSCGPTCKRYACVATREAVAAEREACAKVCDEKVDAEYATGKVDHNEMGWTQACAIAIRARGNT